MNQFYKGRVLKERQSVLKYKVKNLAEDVKEARESLLHLQVSLAGKPGLL